MREVVMMVESLMPLAALMVLWLGVCVVTAEHLPPPQRTLMGQVAYVALAPIRAASRLVWGLVLEAPSAAAEVLDVVADTVVPEAARPVRRIEGEADAGALSLTEDPATEPAP